EHGDAIRDGEGRCYAELIGEVCPFEGAAELIATLARCGIEVVLASSAKEDEVERYIELLGCTELISAALERIAGADAVMVGDSTWDVEAARRAGVPTIAVLTGGFSAAELEEAGAEAVYASVV